MTTSARNPERGSVTILVAFMAIALCGMAAMAVDMGRMYLAKRNLQEAADAAVMAGLSALSTSTSTAQTNAQNMAAKMYSSGVTVTTGTSGTMRTLTVTITETNPFFLAKVFGYTSKTVTATAVGQASPSVPALFAGQNVCSGTPTPVGVALNGNISVTGDIQSNGIADNWGSGTISGSTTYGSGAGCSTNIVGASNSGGSLAYPWSYTAASFTCTYTAASWSFGTIGNPPWQSGGPSGSGVIAPGTYCATAGNIDVSGSTILPSQVTLVATGRITISASTANLTAFDTNTNIIAYTPWTGADCGVPAISIGSGNITLTGNFFAPGGCVNASGTVLNITGSMVGSQVEAASGTASTINSGAGSGNSYSLSQ